MTRRQILLAPLAAAATPAPVSPAAYQPAFKHVNYGFSVRLNPQTPEAAKMIFRAAREMGQRRRERFEAAIRGASA